MRITPEELYGRPGLCRAPVTDRSVSRYCSRRAVKGGLFCTQHGGVAASKRVVVTK